MYIYGLLSGACIFQIQVHFLIVVNTEELADYNITNDVTLGIISTSCSGSNTSIQISDSLGNNANISVTLIWESVMHAESFYVLKTVQKLTQKKVDLILIGHDLAKQSVLKTFMLNPSVPVITIEETTLSIIKSKYDSSEDCKETDPPVYQFEIVSNCAGETGSESTISNSSPSKKESHVIGSILKNVLQFLKWKSTVVFHEKSKDSDVDFMTRQLFDHGVTVTSYAIDDFSENDIMKYLNLTSSHMDDVVNFTILCSYDCVAKIFSVAQKLGQTSSSETFVRHLSQWLVFAYDQNTTIFMCKIAKDIDNVAVIDIPQARNDTRKDLQQLLTEVLIKVKPENAESNKINETDVDFSFLLKQHRNSHTSNLRSLMWGNNYRYLQTVGYVTTAEKSGVHVVGKLFPNILFGFNRRKFLISLLPWDPFVIKYDVGNYSGLCIDLLKHMSASLNFTYQIQEPPDGLWGGRLTNGSWRGLVGQLQRRDVDLTYAPLSAMASREEVMDFAYPFYYDYTTVLLRKPNPLETKWRTLIDPFSDELLICIGLALIFGSLTLYVAERFSPYCVMKPRDENRGLHKFAGAFWCIFGALLTQGGQVRPCSAPGRVFLSCWWVFCIILMATYSGNLIAFLTVSKDSLPFDNLQEMTSQTKYKWGTIGETIWVTALKESKYPEYHKLFRGMQEFNQTDPNVLNTDPAYHMDRVLRGDYAYIGDKTQMEIRMSKECTLQTIEEEFLPLQYAIGLQNNSPYKKIFSDEMLKIHESGLLQIWKTRRWPKRNFCHGDLITEAKAITVIDVQSAFYLLGIGLTLATITCLCERLYTKCKSNCCGNKSSKPDTTLPTSSVSASHRESNELYFR